jgi:hypothetical protein
LVPTDQNVYVLGAGGPNFSFFTTVIVINFEVDYLLNRWSYRNTGVGLVHNFLFPATFIIGKKLIRPTVREIGNLQKADKSILFQIVLGSSSRTDIERENVFKKSANCKLLI